MAIYLFKLVRRKIRESEAKKAVPTTEDSHLVPEVTPGQRQHQGQDNNREHGVIDPATSSNAHALRKTEARKRNVRQMKLLAGLALPNFLAFIDVTIVAPAIPLISSHFSKLTS
jgi:hypothetical protein